MSYRVELPVFCGPLDLLLHLVRQQEVDIHEVRIAHILGQYLEHLSVLKALDLADLGEFLVMASTLMEIKSREMLPTETVEIEEELNPRDDLIRRLLEYKRYRDLSRRLDRLASIRSRMVDARLPLPKEVVEEQQRIEDEEELLDIGDVEVWTLTAVFSKLLEETGQTRELLHVDVEKRDVRHYTTLILEQVREGKEVRFVELFDPSEGRYGMIGAFIAILEMMKQGFLRAHQGESLLDIMVVYRGPADATAEDILTGGDRAEADAAEAEAEAKAEAEAEADSATGD